jgi:hypothetical protein
MRQLHEHQLSTHSFTVGDTVHLSKCLPFRNAALGPFKVTAQLPERDGQLQYRVKSGCEPFYRTVRENELESDVESNGQPAVASRSSAREPGIPQFGHRIQHSPKVT